MDRHFIAKVQRADRARAREMFPDVAVASFRCILSAEGRVMAENSKQIQGGGELNVPMRDVISFVRQLSHDLRNI